MNVKVNPKNESRETSERPPQEEKSEDTSNKLPDRAAFTHELKRRVAESHRFGVTLSTMHIVVKNYAGIEREYGNAVGKLLLDSVARFIGASLRDMDLLATLNPGEFAVMLPGSSDREAHVVATRVQTAIASCAIPLGGKEIQLDLKIGVTGVQPSDEAEKMMERARAETLDNSEQSIPVA